MDDKNELNDLLLGNQKETGSSKKFFLIAAGVLLLFFIIIGIMKFMGSSDPKQSLPITSAEQIKKMPVVPAATPTQDANAVAKHEGGNTTDGADEKLNAIVKKLQQDAQKEAAVATAQPKENVAPKSEQVPVVTKQATQPHIQPKVAEKTTVVAVPIKTATAEQAPQKPKDAMKEVVKKEAAKKEAAKKEDVKTAFKDATKNVVKQKTQPVATKQAPAKKVVPQAAATTTATAGGYYIQVGYFESTQSTKGLSDKVNSIGLGSTTRQAVKNDKNITKVWVGPFDSKEDAAKNLPKVREQIKADAFVVKG